MPDYSRTTESRLKILGALVLLSAFVFVGRLFDLQVFQHDRYTALAQAQQQFSKVEIAQRGKIYVHDSNVDLKSYYPLAFDVKKFSIWVVPNQVSKKQETAAALSPLVGASTEDIYNKINNDKLYIPPIAKNLTLEGADKIKALGLSGTYIVPEYSRYYPEGMLASHILGFVNAEGEGNYGFEGMYNDELKGTSGNVTGEKDTLGRVINLIDQKNPQDGTSFVLTIDRSVQYFTEKKLNEALTAYQAASGTIIIMDIKTGGIVAMASAPSYDPNNFRDYAKDNSGIFINPAVGHLYEPGSIFKPLTMSAAMDKGLLTPDTTGTFDWHVFVDNYEIKTAERKAFGLENMTQVLQNSDNVAMVWVSQLLGKDNEYNYIKNYHMFDKTGIDLSGEAIGYAPQFKQWKDINQATIAFGQGISVTPMEMLAAYATIANKGVYIKPHIVDKIILPDGTEKKVEKEEEGRVISEDTATKMANMLYEVTEKGHSWRAKVPGFKISTKTGTAQIAMPGGGYEDSADGLGIYIHSLAGFAPTDDPRYAMIVKLDRPKSAKYAENTAAPLFGELSSFLLNYYYRITPQ